ncbi:hypothetical protein ABZ729_09745 [Streptomyces sp. NPDC006678]|uniref:hypothetical protein n=1 Tax=Streptomyces sp. NPDC006678 TaxID=3157185 RepID=UPI0034090B7A
MRFAELRPGGLYVKRVHGRPGWELTLIRVSQSQRLWRWNEKRWSYEVAEDVRRASVKHGIGYLAVVPPAAWPETEGIGGSLRRGIQRWARPMAALPTPLPDPSVRRLPWHAVPAREEDHRLSWTIFEPKDVVCAYTSPQELQERILRRMTALGAAPEPVFEAPPPDRVAAADVHRVSLRLDVLAELLERIPDPDGQPGPEAG